VRRSFPRPWSALLLFALLFPALPAAPGHAQLLAHDLEEEIDRVNYAFAAYLGSGIYAASDGAVQVYSAPFSWTLRPPSEGRPGIKLKLPVTIGFYDFKALDLIEGQLPDDVATISFIPGVEFRYPLRENWALTPFIDLGAGIDVSGDKTTWIWSGGVESDVLFARGQTDMTLGNNLQYAAYAVPGEDEKGSFLVLENGLDLARPVRLSASGRTNRFSLYLMNQVYFDELELLRYDEELLEVRYQFEVGVTYIPHRSLDLWLFDITRIGLGYRFGDGLAAFRLIFGMPF